MVVAYPCRGRRADRVDTPDRFPYGPSPIRRHALRNLLEAARALPIAAASEETAPSSPGVATWAEELARAAAGPDGSDGSARLDAVSTVDLRRAISAVLRRLACRADETLAAALARVAQAWEQVDALAMIDEELEGEVARVRRQLAAAAHPGVAAAQRAVALEGLLAIDASVALARLCERRMASLLRLRLRSPARELMPGGRPFLDLGAAFHEAAEAWR